MNKTDVFYSVGAGLGTIIGMYLYDKYEDYKLKKLIKFKILVTINCLRKQSMNHEENNVNQALMSVCSSMSNDILRMMLNMSYDDMKHIEGLNNSMNDLYAYATLN